MSEATTTPQETPASEADPAAPSPADTAKPAPQAEGVTQHRHRHDPAADAAKYRHQLRDTQAELDRIAQAAQVAQATAYDEITKALRAKGQSLIHPDDLQRFTGKGPAEYLNDDGTLDRNALQADFDQLHADRPELFHTIRYMPKPDKSQGHGGDYSAGGQRWKDAFRTRK